MNANINPDGYVVIDTGGGSAYTRHLCPAWRDNDDGGHYTPALCGNEWTTCGKPQNTYRNAYTGIAADGELTRVLAADNVCQTCADKLQERRAKGTDLLDLLEAVPA